jgi:hypothetical protein
MENKPKQLSTEVSDMRSRLPQGRVEYTPLHEATDIALALALTGIIKVVTSETAEKAFDRVTQMREKIRSGYHGWLDSDGLSKDADIKSCFYRD